MKQIICTICTIIIVSFSLFCIVSCGSEEKKSETVLVNLNDYVKLSFYGVNGNGTVAYSFNDKQFRDDFQESLEFIQSENYTGINVMDSFLKDISDYGNVNLLSDRLSNGDTVCFEWFIDKEFLEGKYNITLEYSNFEETVSGLEDVQTNVLNFFCSLDEDDLSVQSGKPVTFMAEIESDKVLNDGAVQLVMINGDNEEQSAYFMNYIDGNKYSAEVVYETEHDESVLFCLRVNGCTYDKGITIQYYIYNPPSDETVMDIATVFEDWIANSSLGNSRIDLTYEMACELTATILPREDGADYWETSYDYPMTGWWGYTLTDEIMNQYLKDLFGSEYDIADYNVSTEKNQEWSYKPESETGHSLTDDYAISAVYPDYYSGISGLLTRESDGKLFFDYTGWGDTFAMAEPTEIKNVEVESGAERIYKAIVQYTWYEYVYPDGMNSELVVSGYDDVTYWLKRDNGSSYGWVVKSVQKNLFEEDPYYAEHYATYPY